MALADCGHSVATLLAEGNFNEKLELQTATVSRVERISGE